MKKRMEIAKMLILCKWLRALDMTRKKELKTGFIKKGPAQSVPHIRLQNFFRSAFFRHKRVVFSLGVHLKPNLNGFII